MLLTVGRLVFRHAFHISSITIDKRIIIIVGI